LYFTIELVVLAVCFGNDLAVLWKLHLEQC
jgi:hypothetical protein